LVVELKQLICWLPAGIRLELRIFSLWHPKCGKEVAERHKPERKLTTLW